MSMRWVTYVSPTDAAEHPGLLVDDRIHGLEGRRSLLDLIAADVLGPAGEQARTAPFEVVETDAVTLRSPLPAPPSVRDFLSFEEHLVNSYRGLGLEVNPAWYTQPVFYFSNPAAVCGPDGDIEISPGSAEFDYELEIAAVVGRAGRNLTPEQAEHHIAGYLILCDWSARDLQRVETPLGLGPAKAKDGATSLGPALVTPEELAPHRSGQGHRLTMTASVNGREYSRGLWSDIYWSFPQMLSYASRGTWLRPGDVIGSGTVGSGCILELSLLHGGDSYPWLRPGDEVRLDVEQLGTITGRIIPGAEAAPLGPTPRTHDEEGR